MKEIMNKNKIEKPDNIMCGSPWFCACPLPDSIPLRGHLPIRVRVIESGRGARLYRPRDPKQMKKGGLTLMVGNFELPWSPLGPPWSPVGPRWPPWSPVVSRGLLLLLPLLLLLSWSPQIPVVEGRLPSGCNNNNDNNNKNSDNNDNDNNKNK